MQINKTVDAGFHTTDDKLSQEYMSICTSVFPENIEELYVKLSNQLFRYSAIASNITWGQGILNEDAIDMNQRQKSSDDMALHEQQTLEQLKLLISQEKEGNLSVDIWEQLTQLTKVGLESSQANVQKKQVLDSQLENYNDKSFSIGDYRSQLQEVIVELSLILKEIEGLRIDSEKRIDRVQVADKHMKRIDQMPHLSEEQRNVLKNILISYTTMRVQSFKAIEKMTTRVIHDYQNYNLCDFHTLDDRDSHLYTVTSKSLAFQNEYFYNQLRNILDYDRFTTNSIKQDALTDMTCMNMTNQYFQTGSVDEKQCLLLLEHGTNDILTEELLVALHNSQSQKMIGIVEDVPEAKTR